MNSFLFDSVKDLKVWQQLLLIAVPLVFALLLNLVLIRENRRKERLSRQAEALKYLDKTRQEYFDKVLAKLGEAYTVGMASASLVEGWFRDGVGEQKCKEIFDEMMKLTVDALSTASLVGHVSRIDNQKRPEYFDDLLQDQFRKQMDESFAPDIRSNKDKVVAMVSVLAVLKRLLQEASNWESLITVTSYAFLDIKKLPLAVRRNVASTESYLHGKMSYEYETPWEKFARKVRKQKNEQQENE